MLDFVKTGKQLDQDARPIFCDKALFRILVDIYLKKKSKFQILIQMLGVFHAANSVGDCTDKYIQGSGIDGSLQQKSVFIVNVVDTVLNGINYKRSFKGYLVLANAIEKWDPFLKIADINPFDGQ